MELMFVIVDLHGAYGITRRAAHATYDDAHLHMQQLIHDEGFEENSLLIEAIESDEDLFYSINSSC